MTNQTNDPIYLTSAGLDKLKAELLDLTQNKRPHVVKRIKESIAQGDLSENSEYEDAKNEQGFIEGRITELQQMLDRAEIVKANSGRDGSITLGTTFSVKHNSKTSKFTVVGPAEADPGNGLISNESPIGQTLLGKKVGDKAMVATPKGETTYRVVSIG